MKVEWYLCATPLLLLLLVSCNNLDREVTPVKVHVPEELIGGHHIYLGQSLDSLRHVLEVGQCEGYGDESDAIGTCYSGWFDVPRSQTQPFKRAFFQVVDGLVIQLSIHPDERELSHVQAEAVLEICKKFYGDSVRIYRSNDDAVLIYWRPHPSITTTFFMQRLSVLDPNQQPTYRTMLMLMMITDDREWLSLKEWDGKFPLR